MGNAVPKKKNRIEGYPLYMLPKTVSLALHYCYNKVSGEQ